MKHLLLTVLIALPAYADWTVGNAQFALVESKEGGLINPSCLSQKNCQALRALKSKVGTFKVKRGGKNPGSEVCKNHYHGIVLIAQNGHTQQAICRFPDESLASLDGLIK